MKVTILIQKKNDIYLFTIRPNKKYVCLRSHVQKNLGSVGINFCLLSAKSEMVVPCFGIRYFIFKISSKPSFVEAVLWAGVSKWAGTRYFYPPEIVYSTGRNYWTPQN
jgi:hypothetical protein